MDIVSLGNKLVKELELEDTCETLQRWMAHYLAELILKAEKAEGAEKASLEQECFDTILKLWGHRAALPGQKPLESFKPIFNLLDYIQGPKNAYSWYMKEQELERETKDNDWLKLALRIDGAARALIRWCLAMASLKAKNEDKWINSGIPKVFSDTGDFKAAQLLSHDAEALVSNDKTLAEYRTKELKDIYGKLEAFLKLSRKMKKDIDKQLKKLN